MISVLISLLQTLRGLAQSRAALHLEVLALRHQLQVLQRTRPRRVRVATADRWLWVSLSRVWIAWRTALVIVKPETVIAWPLRVPGWPGPARAEGRSARQNPFAERMIGSLRRGCLDHVIVWTERSLRRHSGEEKERRLSAGRAEPLQQPL